MRLEINDSDPFDARLEINDSDPYDVTPMM